MSSANCPGRCLTEVIFTDDALNSIHDATNGVPARVIALCNLTLLAAMGRDQTSITSEFVEAAFQRTAWALWEISC